MSKDDDLIDYSTPATVMADLYECLVLTTRDMIPVGHRISLPDAFWEEVTQEWISKLAYGGYRLIKEDQIPCESCGVIHDAAHYFKAILCGAVCGLLEAHDATPHNIRTAPRVMWEQTGVMQIKLLENIGITIVRVQ